MKLGIVLAANQFGIVFYMNCKTEQMNIGRIWIDQQLIDMNPSYQREAGVWSKEKQQLFIDSLLNGYDVPKLYLNEFPPDEKFRFAVIDGKQRLSALLDFMSDKYSLAEDFKYQGSLRGGDCPQENSKYSKFTERAKEVFKSISLHVTKIENASEEDIEALFARLNNGESLNSAESRNAIGGEMAELIRTISDRQFFKNKIKFTNNRYAHREVACKLLFIEDNRRRGGTKLDLKKKFLDEFVRTNKNISGPKKKKLVLQIDASLKDLEKCFDNQSQELAKQSYPQFFYLWVHDILELYAHKKIHQIIKDFIPAFTLMRKEENQKPEEERDPVLIEFGRLTQQGTNDAGSMEKRCQTMTKYLLKKHPDLLMKDPKRAFNTEERNVIWLKAEKKCEKCKKLLPELIDMHADHNFKHSIGGRTVFANARCLCISCNTSDNQK